MTVVNENEEDLLNNQRSQLDELKDQFLLNMSHELRTPLAVMGIGLELLKRQYEHLDQKKRADVLTMIEENYEVLVRLVDQVLHATTYTEKKGSAQCEVVHVRQIVHEVLESLDPRDIQAYTFSLSIPEQISVWADPQYLGQILHHLLDNIFKYVPKHTAISIETTQLTPSSPVCLRVQDAGPGIPPKELPLLFKKYVRLKRDLAGPTRGLGLGLYICKLLVDAMGGLIWVESSSRTGKGSCFCFTLPAFPPFHRSHDAD
jgi:K+-sensing histidine kinase KdpD